jgi:NAD(P)-dependent dehydrogenase (short-subunit alcohol dehydrogenase family)
MAATEPLRILLTGGGRGIGRGLVRILASKGHKLYLFDHNTEELTHTSQ